MNKAKEILRCPDCGSDQISEDEVERSPGQMLVRSSCDDCDSEFEEVFVIKVAYQVEDEGNSRVILSGTP